MEQILYLALGAFLALLGGIITQHIQNHQTQIKEDRNCFFKAFCSLVDYSPVFERLVELNSTHSHNIEEKNKLIKLQEEELKLLDNIAKQALRIRAKKHLDLAANLYRFGLQDIYRNKKHLSSLIRETAMMINNKLIQTNKNQIQGLLDKLQNLKDDKDIEEAIEVAKKLGLDMHTVKKKSPIIRQK